MASDDREETQVTCRFVTKLDDEFRVPDSAIAVPGRLGRYGLSEVINHLLGLDPPKPFDFLVQGELLRASLEKHLASRGLTAEAELEVEYLPVVAPPKPEAQGQHEDWVSALYGGGLGGALLSGSYDGVARLWDDEANCTCEMGGHEGGINAVSALGTGASSDGRVALLTASKDRTARLWLAPLPGATAGGKGGKRGAKKVPSHRPPIAYNNKGAAAGGAAEEVCVFRGHTDAVESVAGHPDGRTLVTGSWDSAIRLWTRPTGEEIDAARAEAAPAGKKRRGGGGGAEAGAMDVAGSKAMEGHTQCVSSVAWEGLNRVVSGSWDHSVRIWDAASQVNVETLHGGKAVYDVSVRGGAGAGVTSPLVAVGGADKAVRVWDPRSSTLTSEAVAVKLYNSHGGWVSSVSWHPTSEHHLASGSYDGTVKLWDLRSQMPLHTVRDHDAGTKVLAVCWAVAGGRVASGGEDCHVRIHTADLGA